MILIDTNKRTILEVLISFLYNNLMHIQVKKWLLYFYDFVIFKKYLRILKSRIAIKKKYSVSNNLVLIEGLQPLGSQLAILHFLLVLRQKFDGINVTCFYNRPAKIHHRLILRFKHKYSLLSVLQKPIGFHQIRLTSCSNKVEIENLQMYSKVVSPEILETFVYKKIIIGDLIYDTFLLRTNSATINFKDKRLQEIFFEALALVDYWENYFKHNLVKTVCISHCVYLGAIVGRVALHNDISVYQVNTNSIYKIDKNNLFAYSDFKHYKKSYKTLPEDVQINGIEKAKKRLELRFNGQVGIDMFYSSKSAFAEKTGINPLIPSNRIKVLIAVHDFYDSPHSFGNNFYPDFMIWLEKLNQLSETLDYDWYVKTHADVTDIGQSDLQEFIDKSNGFKLIPKSTSHYDLIDGGIDCVLTVFGSVALEYAALGKLCINASRNNPHVEYNFSFTPVNREDYEFTICNLQKFLDQHRVAKAKYRDEIYEYYFMHNIYNFKDWLFYDSDQLQRNMLSYENSLGYKLLKYYVTSDNVRKFDELYPLIINFLESDSQTLNNSHLNFE